MKYLFLLLLLAVQQVKAQDCTGKLSGHVHHATIHENLQGAMVIIQPLNKTLITNDKGDFAFDSLCRGTYTLIVTYAGYDTVRQVVNLANSLHVDIDLLQPVNTLQGVIVTAQRSPANTGYKKELVGSALEETRGQSLAEALGKLNGVTLLQTGSNISKPVIHGLHGNRILTINNGVRQEGQQWGNEHAPEIDPFIAGKLTVIKGVDELRYGSDAIGGVVLVEPKPLRGKPGYSAEVNGIYFSNNRQYTLSGVWEEQLKTLPAFTYRLQGTYRKGANVNTPNYRLNNTGLNETSFSLTTAWRKASYSSELFYSFFNTNLGIFKGAHIGNLSDLKNAIASERPDPTFTGQNTYRIERPSQDVTHHLLKSKTAYERNGHRFSLLVAAQFNNRKEYDIVRSGTNEKPQLDLSIATLSEDLSWEHPKTKNVLGIIGLSAMQQTNSYSGRYIIPAYTAYHWGGYWIEKWNHKQWDVQAGIRYDYKTIATNRLLSSGITFDHFKFDFSTLGSSANVGYRLTEHWKVNTTVGLSSRSPHVNELLSNGIHHGTATYEEGDIRLQPEHSLNLSLNNSFTNREGTLSIEATLYRNRIKDFIFQQPLPEEPVLTIAGAFPKISYQQTDALLKGFDIATIIKPASRLELSTKYSLLRAYNSSIDDWLIGMPSDRIQNEITFFLKDKKHLSKTYFSLEMVNAFKQRRVPAEHGAAIDYKAPPDGYTLLHADASATIQFKQFPVVVGMGVRNLLNTSYREYLNSLRYFTDEAGRNIQFRLKIPLEHFY